MVFLSISFNLNALRLQVLTGKESNFPFIINVAKSDMLQGKCLQFLAFDKCYKTLLLSEKHSNSITKLGI